MLQHKTFSASFVGLMRKANNEKVVNDVAQQAVDWVTAQKGSIVVERMSVSQAEHCGHAVVFYRSIDAAN